MPAVGLMPENPPCSCKGSVDDSRAPEGNSPTVSHVSGRMVSCMDGGMGFSADPADAGNARSGRMVSWVDGGMGASSGAAMGRSLAVSVAVMGGSLAVPAAVMGGSLNVAAAASDDKKNRKKVLKVSKTIGDKSCFLNMGRVFLE